MMRRCDMRLTRGLAEPRAPALKRFSTGPGSTRARNTVRELAERLLLFSALATALLSVLARRRADLRGMSVRKSMASGTERPWIWFAISRTLRGDMRALRVRAWISMVVFRLGRG